MNRTNLMSPLKLSQLGSMPVGALELSSSSVPSNRNKSTVLLGDGGKLKNWLRIFTFLPERVNYFRDFSDGTKVKEIICQLLPNTKVNHKMLLPSDNIKVKRKNWNYLYENVFPQLGLRLPNDMAEKMLDGKSEIMESILIRLMMRLEKNWGNPPSQRQNAAQVGSSPVLLDQRQRGLSDRLVSADPIYRAAPKTAMGQNPLNKFAPVYQSMQQNVGNQFTLGRSGIPQPAQDSHRAQIPDWVTRFPAKIPQQGGYMGSAIASLNKSRPKLDREIYSDELILASKSDGKKNPKSRKLLLDELAKRDKSLTELQKCLYAIGQQAACLERLMEVRKKTKYLQRHQNDPTFKPIF